MTTLAIKELMSGKVVPFDQTEYPVCGGRAVVRRTRDNKVTLRCRGQNSIVVTRKNETGSNQQEFVKNGVSIELKLLDIFFANGTLSKYQVTNGSSVGISLPVQSKSSTVIKETKKSAQNLDNGPKKSPIEVELAEKPSVVDLVDDDATSSDGGVSSSIHIQSKKEVCLADESSDEEDIIPRKRQKISKIVIHEDVDESECSQDTNSNKNDEVNLPKKSEISSTSASWDQFKFQSQKENGWISTKRSEIGNTEDLYKMRLKSLRKNEAPRAKGNQQKARNERRIIVESDEEDEMSDGVDESDDGRPHRTKLSRHDEVSGMLQSCESLSTKLKNSISKWGKSEMDEEVSLTTIENKERMLEQKDIPGLSPSLVLQPYQVVGVNWLYLLFQHKVSAVLADEMGLGKTVQTISFLSLVCSQLKLPHLIIVPASVLSNWKREFERFAPSLRIHTFHGSASERMDVKETLRPGSFDALLTTYSYFERDSSVDDRKFLRSFDYGYLVLDEGHNIKNANTSRFKRIAALKSRNRLVLSGTPIQNNLSELLALLSFLMPTIFNHGSDQLLEFFGGEERTSCTKIRKILAPFILRRLKKFVLAQMVPKTELVEKLTMNPDQQEIYDKVVQSALSRKENSKEIQVTQKKKKLSRELELLAGNIRPTAPRAKGKNDPNSDSNVFTLLRKAANHPILLRHHFGCPKKLEKVARHLYKNGEFGSECSLDMVKTEIEGYSDFDLHQLCIEYSHIPEMKSFQLSTEVIFKSAKFNYLENLLPKLKKENHRVLIFSQWTKMLDLLEAFMTHSNHRYTRLDGSTDIEMRQNLIDEFNQDKSIFCFLLSTRAGGLGINLTAADTVILHDLDFNPTLDAQAMDRCHRIGQTKPVTVYKLVTENSVDNSIYDIACRKMELNDTILGNLGKKSRDTQAADIQTILTSVLAAYKDKLVN